MLDSHRELPSRDASCDTESGDQDVALTGAGAVAAGAAGVEMLDASTSRFGAFVEALGDFRA